MATPHPHLPPLPASRRRTIARLVIAFVIAALVALPALGAGTMDVVIVFVLAFGVSFVALLLVTNP